MTDKITRDYDKGKFATQDVDASIELIEDWWVDKEYALTDLETENTKFNKVDKAKATVVPTEDDYITPRFDDEVEITINGERVFTGRVFEVNDKENASFEIKCFNDTRKLQNTKVNIGTEEDFVKAADLLREQILRPADVLPPYYFHFGQENPLNLDYGEIRDSQAQNLEVRFDEAEMPAIKAVDKVAKKTNSVWWVNGKGQFRFGNPQSDVYVLSWVKDTSVGKTTPPYRSVKVVGAGNASHNSWTKSNLIPKDSTTAIRSIKQVRKEEEAEEVNHGGRLEVIANDAAEEDEDSVPDDYDIFQTQSGELIEPVYLFRDKSIRTKQEAIAVAVNLIEKLVQQTRQGWVEIVGWAPIEPFDVIEMPEHMGGEQYMVQGVEHSLDSSDGFTTKIRCGGLVHTGDIEVEERTFND